MMALQFCEDTLIGGMVFRAIWRGAGEKIEYSPVSDYRLMYYRAG